MSKKTDSPNIMSEYIELTRKYQTIYGVKTVVLLQVGAFFEIYGLKDETTITESQIEEVCQFCQLNISEKKVIYQNKQQVMAGFRDYVLEKYLQKITENGYAAVVYVQEKDGKNVKRVFQGVYSSGTYISYETDNVNQLTNNIMCIWLDTCKSLERNSLLKTKDTLIYGVSCANIFTGQSSIFENEMPFIMNPTTFDELERFVSVNSPSEVIIISPFEKKIVNTILQYVGLKTNTIHFVDLLDEKNEKTVNCTKQKYIKHILSCFFGEETYNICKEFENNILATQSFCYLMNFIQEHNPDLVRNISIPYFNNTTDRVLLANHTLKQLNIIDDVNEDGMRAGNLSSVLSFLNKCSCAMGRRKFKQHLLNPTTNTEWLSNEYNMITNILLQENEYIIDVFRKSISKIRDVEKMCRQLVVKRLYPSSIYHIHNNIGIIQQLNTCIAENKQLCSYLCKDIGVHENSYTYIESTCKDIMDFLEKSFHIDHCKTTNSIITFDENIIQRGISSALDSAIDNYNKNLAFFKMVRNDLTELIKDNGGKDDTEYVKIHETEKSGMSLQITKTRGVTLKKIIKNKLECAPLQILAGLREIPLRDIKFTKASESTEEIEIPILDKVSKEILYAKDKINTLISETYLKLLCAFEKENFTRLENLCSYVSNLDVIINKAYVARTYKYCKPELMENDNSMVSTKELRHCLIEHIQQNETYVTNDIALGSDCNGILLYGTNAVGKTSFIRALGISIIMAQSGMFVPCSRFQYTPYKSIFSRILGNDNLFKGLSTFAVEMSELRIILKMADENSLILGDELCSGTETESALSIFVAGLTELHEKNTTFIFATHFHEIINYDEIKCLRSLHLKHMSVIYDRELDCLVYDRKLKDGPGTRTYGLEVCKSLYLPDEFLEKAYAIRNKYYPDTNGYLSQKTSQYNAGKIKGVCEICKKNIGEEVHHLEHQKDADQNGFVGSFHKNHLANLLMVCEKCHNQLHDNSMTNVVKEKKKTSKGYLLTSSRNL